MEGGRATLNSSGELQICDIQIGTSAANGKKREGKKRYSSRMDRKVK